MGAGPGAGRGWARSERCSAQGPPAHLGRRRALSDTEEEQSAAPRWGAPTSPGLMNIGVRGRGLCGTGAWIASREAQGHVRGHSCMATTPQRGGTPGAQGRLWIWGERRAIEARAWQTVTPPRDQVSHLRCLGDTVSGMRPDISNQVLRDAQEKVENESSLAV